MAQALTYMLNAIKRNTSLDSSCTKDNKEGTINEKIPESLALSSKSPNGPAIDITKPCVSVEPLKEDEFNNLAEPLIEKSFNLANYSQSNIDVIKSKANECKLSYEIIHDRIKVLGCQQAIFSFLEWLYNFLNMCISMQTQEFSHDEVSISTFHRIYKEDIIEKAHELNITCDFRYHVILMTGLSKNLKEFKSYLHQVETAAKKALYPKYWELNDTSIYSEIEVSPRSTEFQEIAHRMHSTLPQARIEKITRIQNNYLMTQYITNLNMRQEVRKSDLNRQLLFHGTALTAPEKIYKTFDTGFDIQYSKTTGLYGGGLYFAQNASYSHGYAYPDKGSKGRLNMFLADVFVGKHYTSLNKENFIKAPDGYDSVWSLGEFYIIYNNFHSYPLYLIEYIYDKDYNALQDQNLLSASSTIQSTGNTSINQASTSGNSNGIISSLKNQPRAPVKKKPTYEQKICPMALKRVQKELDELKADETLETIFIEIPNQDDISKWTVRIVGPYDSAYEGGIFEIEVTFPWGYPLNPPALNFQTKIYHPSVDSQGKVCLGLLSNWTPALDLRQVLLTLSAMLGDPLMEEPLMLDLAYQYKHNKIDFMKAANSWTRKYAA